MHVVPPRLVRHDVEALGELEVVLPVHAQTAHHEDDEAVGHGSGLGV